MTNHYEKIGLYKTFKILSCYRNFKLSDSILHEINIGSV